MSNIFANMKDPDQENTLTKSILSDKNCLITGATGATGKLLVNQLLENGHEVKAFALSLIHI